MLGLLAVGLGSLGVSPPASARDVVFLYGGYSDDVAFKRTVREGRLDHTGDRVVDVIAGEDLEELYDDLIVLEGEGEILWCGGGSPPDMKLLEIELEELKRQLDFQGQVDAYTRAIEQLPCAGERFDAAEAAALYVARAMVHYKNGDEDLAQDDFWSAFVIDPGHQWDKRHTPKAKPDFEAAKADADEAYSYSVYAADDGPFGSGIKIDGRALRAGEPVYLLPGDHLISWRGKGDGDSGILRIDGSVTLIASPGLLDFLFREPADRVEEWLREEVLDELRWREDVDDVVLLEPKFAAGSLSKGGRYASLARAAVGGGYTRYSTFDYGAIPLDLWIRISGPVHAELRVEFALTSGSVTTAGGTAAPPDDGETAGESSDYYVLPAVQIGVGFRETHGPVQPGGGIAARFYFTGPSLLLMPAVVVPGGVDIRAWDAPVAVRIGGVIGAIVASDGNDPLGRDLDAEGESGRLVAGFNLSAAFIL